MKLVSDHSVDGFLDLARQFRRDLTCKEHDECDILPVGPGSSTLIKRTTKLIWRDFHLAVISNIQNSFHRLSKVALIK